MEVGACVQEGLYERVYKKVRTSVCVRRIVRACAQEDSYKFRAEEIKVD